MSSSSSEPLSSTSDAAGRRLGRVLLAALRGEDVHANANADIDANVDADAERIVEEQDVAAALWLAHVRTLPMRVAAAVAADRVSVTLADGAVLSLSDAEKQLAAREATRVFLPLRLSIAQALRPVDQPAEARRAWRQALALPEPAPSSTQTATLTSFLRASQAVGEAARDVLADRGGVDVDSGVALDRALDLPNDEAFSDVAFLALAKAAREALPKDARALVRVPAPRACAGAVVTDDDAVRVCTAPSRRAARFAAQARGLGDALAAAVPGAARRVGLGLFVAAPALRRAVGLERALASFAFHVVVARAIIDARAAAAGALVVAAAYADFDEERERARDAVRAAVGVDVGDGPALARLLAPWPDGGAVRGAAAAVVDAACARAAAAADYAFVRDALDEGALARPRSLSALRELPPIMLDDSAGARFATAWAALLDDAAR